MYVIVDKCGNYWDSDDEEWVDVITEGCIFYTSGRAKSEIKDFAFDAKVKEITFKDVD